MLFEDFEARAKALVPPGGWETHIAKRLGIDSRQVRRWRLKGQTSAWVAERLDALEAAASPRPDFAQELFAAAEVLGGAEPEDGDYRIEVRASGLALVYSATDSDGAEVKRRLQIAWAEIWQNVPGFLEEVARGGVIEMGARLGREAREKYREAREKYRRAR